MLNLTTGMLIAESKLSMLSPTGRSRMWDRDVDGYARGEGLAAIVLKPLSQAIADNDHIECLIRGTSVNQDGKTKGITMPSGKAQAALIRDTYRRAGLDINKPEDRPQFFHAHGTGTAAGDPQEAEAISTAFFPEESTYSDDDKLYVGSVKTIIGHTEGTAGLASLVSTSQALQHRTIPPNMHFNNLNPKLEPFYKHLEVPTKAMPWPQTINGAPMRASINSFGFGGTNAHAILEEYIPEAAVVPAVTEMESRLVTPLVFSAASESSLRSMLADFSGYLMANPDACLQNVAYTLQSRRTTLKHRVALYAADVDDAISQIDAITSGSEDSTIATRQPTRTEPIKILGIFTGQGSQWARMGARLLETSPFIADRLAELDEALATSPAGESPSWKLSEMILADPKSSRMSEAAISQPLCTAVQICMVDLLRAAGIEFHAVVGHSSGEIGAAYAAGLYSARDAIRAAYYRGLYAKLAKSPNVGKKGCMMAVGTTFADATEFCELEWFEGRLQVAAINSASSITLSGDEDAVDEACEIFQDEGKFARKLKVDTAYHSSHVLECSESYLNAMSQCDTEEPAPMDKYPKWYSSVREGEIMTKDDVEPQYWIDNMCSPVLFGPAVEWAWADSGSFDLVIEVGPHPVLKTPALDTIEEVGNTRPPYTGVLGRTKDDVQEFAKALGFVWTQCGHGSVSFEGVERLASPSKADRQLVADLPAYPFDHSKKFLALSRVSGYYATAQAPPHPLLGKRCLDRETSMSVQWRNVFLIKEIPWLTGHQIHGQTVFPAAGFVSMAIEAVNILAKDNSIGLVTLENVKIGRAMAFNDEDSHIETIFDIKITHQNSAEIVAEWACYSGDPHDIKSAMSLNASGIVKAELSIPEPDLLPTIEKDLVALNDVDTERFYGFLANLGYHYGWPFHGTTEIKRKGDYAAGLLEDQSGDLWEDQLLVHPGVIDTALQTTFAAFCCPGDERLWTLHVPTGFKSIVINPYFTYKGIGKQKQLQYVSSAKDGLRGKISAELSLLTVQDGHTFMQAEGMELVPISAALPEDDLVLFSRFDYRIADADGCLTATKLQLEDNAVEIANDIERASFFYLHDAVKNITPDQKAKTLPQYRHLLNWAEHIVDQVQKGEMKHIPAAAERDTKADIDSLLKK